MNMQLKKIAMPFVLVALMTSLAACGSSSSTVGAAGSGDSGTVEQDNCTGLGCGVFDEGQQIISDVVGGVIAGALPEPLSGVVSCGSDVVVNLLEVPEGFIESFSSTVSTQDPVALLGIVSSSANGLGDVVSSLYGMFGAITGAASSCGTGSGSSGGGSPLDTFSPLETFLSPLIDSLALFTGDAALDESGPAGVLIAPMRTAAEALLGVIGGGSPLDFDLSMFDLAGGQNNMLGALQGLQSQLQGATGGDLDIGQFAAISGAIQQAMAVAVSQGGSALQGGAGGEIPVIGGLLDVIQGGLLGNFDIMNAIGGQDNALIGSGAEALLENNLLGVFTEILPLGSIGDQAGVDVIGLVQGGIERGISQLGGGSGLSLDSLFDVFSAGDAGQSSNPAEQFLSGMLESSPIGFDGLLSGGLGQLFGSISQLVPTELELEGIDAGPLDALLGGLPALDEGVDGGVPLDLMLGSLVESDPTGVFGDLLGPLESTVETFFGAFTGLFSRG